MKRLNVKTWLIALLALGALTACDMMKEDLDDCPTGLYVNFVYDYNIQRADMFKDHVGTVTLYVYDESDQMVAQKSMSGDRLTHYGSYIHFTEQELAPGHSYRLMAVAFQRDALSASGAKYRLSGNNIGDQWNQFFVTLDHSTTRLPANYYVSNAAPLDTLWHTLTTVVSPVESQPMEVTPASLTPARCEYSWQRDGSIKTNGQETVTLVCGEPTYATVALIRDTKHLNITLRSIDNEKEEDNMVNYEDFTVEIVDNNAQLDCRNNLSAPQDTLRYTPYQQWNTKFVGNGEVASEQAAHYDLMFNRLVYKNASVTEDQYAILDEADIAKARNAVLLIRKKDTGDIVFGINLPYILSSGRTYQERYYHYQEYLDREYDYRLQFILKGGRVDELDLYIGTEVHIVPWTVRQQHENLE